MIGPRQVAQGALFYEFSIEDHVPLDHLLRAMDRFVNLGDMRRHLAPFYSSTGRPSVDPELMIRMLIVGYAFGIRLERRLCEEVHLNLAYRWFCRLDLSDPCPNGPAPRLARRTAGRSRSMASTWKVTRSSRTSCCSATLLDGQSARALRLAIRYRRN